jgi:hypothetical protein
MLGIAKSYDSARIADCRTVGLLPRLDPAAQNAWWDYLLNYTIALAGCPPAVTPLPGGISVFGPANTAAIGIPRQPLTEHAAELMLDKYVTAFQDALGLSAQERASLMALMRTTLIDAIDEDASDWTSRCSADGGLGDGGHF